MNAWFSVVLLLALTQPTFAQLPYYRIGETSTLPAEQKAAGSRPLPIRTSSQDGIAVGRPVAWLEIYPEAIRIPVGETYSLNQIRVFAHSQTGEILSGVPLNLEIEGPKDLFSFEILRNENLELKAIKRGLARLWIQSSIPDPNGDYPRQAIVLVVD